MLPRPKYFEKLPHSGYLCQPGLDHRGAHARRRTALRRTALSSRHAGQIDELVTPGHRARAHGRAGALVRLPAQGRTAHLFRQPPEPRRPGDDLGGPAGRIAQHHPAHRRQGLLDQDAVQAVDHHRGLQCGLRGARAQGRRRPAAAAGGGAGSRRLAHHLPRGHARPCRGAAAVQVRPVQPGAEVSAGGAGAGLDRQHPAGHAQGRSRPGADPLFGDLRRADRAGAEEERRAFLDRARQAVIALREI